MGDKIPEDKKSELEGAIAEAKAVLENQEADVEALKAPKDKMVEIMQSFAEELYKAQAAEQGAAAPEGEGASSEPKQAEDAETVDADFEVVDEDKK
jgi:molecular chaperone DnaK